MSEEFTVEAVLEPIIDEAPAQTDAPVKKAKATKNVVEATEDNKEEVTQKVISGPEKKKTTRTSNVHAKDNGAIGSHAADRALARKIDTTVKQEKKDESEKIAVWSDKNIRWSDVGNLVKGYNIVNKEAAAKWLARQGIREATPEEVATHYGK
jgi:hypothetical protein